MTRGPTSQPTVGAGHIATQQTLGPAERAAAFARGAGAASILYALLALIAATMMVPYVWMLSSSVKTTTNFFHDPVSLLPQSFNAANYRYAWEFGRMGVFVRNTFVYTFLVVAVQLFVDSIAAYSFARIQFRGRDALFLAVLSTMMLPGAVTLIPTYVLVYTLGLSNTVLGVVIPSFAGAFGIFLLRQFFLNIPSELEDAALIDGAGLFRIYWQIVIPLAKPAIITLGLFLVLGEWQSFIWPLVVLSDIDKYPVTVGLNFFRNMNRILWPELMAGSVLATVPLIAAFLIAQKFIIGGIALSGLKG